MKKSQIVVVHVTQFKILAIKLRSLCYGKISFVVLVSVYRLSFSIPISVTRFLVYSCRINSYVHLVTFWSILKNAGASFGHILAKIELIFIQTYGFTDSYIPIGLKMSKKLWLEGWDSNHRSPIMLYLPTVPQPLLILSVTLIYCFESN